MTHLFFNNSIQLGGNWQIQILNSSSVFYAYPLELGNYTWLVQYHETRGESFSTQVDSAWERLLCTRVFNYKTIIKIESKKFLIVYLLHGLITTRSISVIIYLLISRLMTRWKVWQPFTIFLPLILSKNSSHSLNTDTHHRSYIFLHLNPSP